MIKGLVRRGAVTQPTLGIDQTNTDMALKGKKKEKKEKKEKKNSEKKKPKQQKKATSRGRREGKTKGRFQVDIFTEAAMQNAYHTCHNVQDLLKNRGFHWPELQKKKKKGKRK